MYHPTTRVLTVLELLQARGRMSGPELAERLEVDLRTIRRYITMLQDLGIPVEGERGRAGGYRIRPGFKLPPLMLSNEEAMAVTLGLFAAQRLGLVTSAPAVEGALAKIERLLPPDLRRHVSAAQDALTFDLPAPEFQYGGEVVSTLGEAAIANRRVWLRYADGQGEVTERDVDPYGLVFLSGRWYVAGYCHLRSALRSFRADRIVRIEPSDDRFLAPEDFDALGFVRSSLATAPATWAVEVLLKTTLDRASRMVPPSQGVLEAVDGGVLVRCWVDDLGWIGRRLFGMDCEFDVLAPPELRATMTAIATAIVGRLSVRPTNGG